MPLGLCEWSEVGCGAQDHDTVADVGPVPHRQKCSGGEAPRLCWKIGVGEVFGVGSLCLVGFREARGKLNTLGFPYFPIQTH